MEQLLKIGENENVGGEVELSEFEKKLEFARLGFSTTWTTKDGTSIRPLRISKKDQMDPINLLMIVDRETGWCIYYYYSMNTFYIF